MYQHNFFTYHHLPKLHTKVYRIPVHIPVFIPPRLSFLSYSFHSFIFISHFIFHISYKYFSVIKSFKKHICYKLDKRKQIKQFFLYELTVIYTDNKLVSIMYCCTNATAMICVTLILPSICLQ